MCFHCCERRGGSARREKGRRRKTHTKGGREFRLTRKHDSSGVHRDDELVGAPESAESLFDTGLEADVPNLQGIMARKVKTRSERRRKG
jgi:hypothetical protein